MSKSSLLARLFLSVLVVFSALSVLAACSSDSPKTAVQPPPATPPSLIGTLQFVESIPEETNLDLLAFAQAADLWPQVIDRAQKKIDVGSFYFSRMGDGKDAQGPDGVQDLLLPCTRALETAANRGVQVRVLGDSKFQQNYPEFLAEIDAVDGAESRAIDYKDYTSGVMHAKYFVMDESTLYVGSQNWDWRALGQIRELGALVEHPHLAEQLRSIFEMDWALAAGQSISTADPGFPSPDFESLPPVELKAPDGTLVAARLAASPRDLLPRNITWDLPLIVELMDSARSTLRLQLLSYNVSDRDGNYFQTLDNALRRAAARKVKVEILLSNWSKVNYKLHWIQSLAAVHGIDVKFSNIPEHSKGFIPFGRVEHPKYLVVDGQAAWVGTSNWSRDYFFSSRNISLFFHGQGAGEPLEKFFAQGWNSPYTELVDPSGQYEPPRRN